MRNLDAVPSSEEILTVLKAAKNGLTTGDDVRTGDFRCYRHTRICNAIHYSCVDLDVGNYVRKNIIGLRMDGFAFIEEWLYVHEPGFAKMTGVEYEQLHIYVRRHHDYLQDYRHRWLDSLIKEFGGKV